ncbi:hypothetical protein O3299_15630 [Janthinobacterium sp. SUN176]|uniref:hypothetical protein n=1 Tax=Janthinobacterium sp. SUN176 TaxID=3014788 RepID=UPI0027142434|nr:hypothetical protein [Janthinobacterium sp. SUN176]MDO8072962.1 hypothetical protein [Janthinobacterium sp. SUN176]
MTVGPGNNSSKHVIKLGDAAHIHAASELGPRFDINLPLDERKAIDNGIWMCQRHARIIDADFTQYSAATLRTWKIQAENKAYVALRLPNRQPRKDSASLMQLGMDIVFEGKWIAAGPSEWTLEVDSYVYGNDYSLKDFCSQFLAQHERARFIVIHDQGDGRKITQPPSWKSSNNKLQLTVAVADKYVRQDPHQTGSDLALSESGDIFIKDGDIAIVKGIESAKQHVTTSLGICHGDLMFQPEVGSLFPKYFWDHREDKELLSSLLMLELARLASLPDEGRESSPLGFINRVTEVTFETTEIFSGRVFVIVEIEWGNRELTRDRYSIFVDHSSVRAARLAALNESRHGKQAETRPRRDP